jgi:hypothetical protein
MREKLTTEEVIEGLALRAMDDHLLDFLADELDQRCWPAGGMIPVHGPEALAVGG